MKAGIVEHKKSIKNNNRQEKKSRFTPLDEHCCMDGSYVEQEKKKNRRN